MFIVLPINFGELIYPRTYVEAGPLALVMKLDVFLSLSFYL